MIKPELGIASTKPVLNWMIKTLKMIHFCFNVYSVSGRGAVGCGFLLDVGKEIRQDDTGGSFQPSELNLQQVHFFLTLYSPLFVLLVLFYFVFVLFLTCCCPVFLQWASSVSAACTSFLWVFLRTTWWWQEADISMPLCPSSIFQYWPIPEEYIRTKQETSACTVAWQKEQQKAMLKLLW